MKKVRVYFPEVEAGMGHIMPITAIKETFEKKYGHDDRIEIICDHFFKKDNNETLIKYEKGMINALVAFQKNHFFGHFANFFDFTLPPRMLSYFSIRFGKEKAYKEMCKAMDKTNPDIVFSTHWVSNYVARTKKGKRPYTIMFCPDCTLDRLFTYPSDLKLISTDMGYKKSIGKFGHNEDNFKQVKFSIRNEAFTTERDKKKLRREIGIPEDKFTIIIVEGAYGNGRLEKLCKALIKTDLDITILAICGKNPNLVNYLSSLEVNPHVTFKPIGFIPQILKYISASDLYLGKAGNGINEATFFNVPSIITSYTNFIEGNIGKYFIKYVGSAQKCSKVKKIVKLIKEYSQDRSKLEPYIKNCQKSKDHFGSEQSADYLYQAIEKEFFNKN